MYAAYVEELGPADNIRYGELPTPQPGPTDVLVAVSATAVNPVDTFVRSGLYPTPTPFPFVIGRDLVGTVAAVGAGVAGFRVGDAVWSNSLGHGGRQGAAAEFAVVAADRLYHLPARADPVAVVAVAHPAATAYLALRHGRVRAGDTVLVGGGAGNVGSALVTLAVRAGARVIATASSADLSYCRSLGAADVLDYHDSQLAQQIRDRCPDGVDVHIDTSGCNVLVDAVDMLAVRGRIVLLAGAQSQPVLPASELYRKDGSIIGFVISRATVPELSDAARAINQAVPDLTPRDIETRPLADAATAHHLMEQGSLHGKRLVLRTSATA